LDENRQGFWLDEKLDPAGEAGLSADEGVALEGENHLVN
jgi:hypothetical protein